MNKQAFFRGFLKAAAEANQDSSFIGRYLAAKNIPGSIMANKRQIMDDIDPTGEQQEKDFFHSGQSFRKQREKAYDYLRPTLKRESAGTYGKNALIYGLLGSLVGAASGANASISTQGRIGLGEGAGLGAGAGALAGAGLGVAGRAFNKYEQRKVTPEDVSRMKTKQKDRGFLSEFMPGRDIWDAAKA